MVFGRFDKYIAILSLSIILGMASCDLFSPGLGDNVDITAPVLDVDLANESYVKGDLTLTGVWDDDGDIKSIEVYIGSVKTDLSVTINNTAKTWTVLIPTTEYSDGSKEITIHITDKSGKSTEKSVVLYFDNNPPVVLVKEPLDLSGSFNKDVTIRGEVADKFRIETVEILLFDSEGESMNWIENGADTGSNRKLLEDMTNSWSFDFDSETYTDSAGSFSFEVVATDLAGNSNTYYYPYSDLLTANGNASFSVDELELLEREGDAGDLLLTQDILPQFRQYQIGLTIDQNDDLPTFEFDTPSVESPSLAENRQAFGRILDDDGVKVSSIEISLNGGDWTVVDDSPMANSTTASWSHDLSALGEGFFTLQVRAEDIYGTASESDALDFVIDSEGPSLDLLSPASGSYLNSDISISGVCSDNLGVAGVEMSLDGGSYETIVSYESAETSDDYTVNPDNGLKVYNWSYVMPAPSEGSHTLRFRAVDLSGKATTESIQIYLDSVDPVVNFLTPQENGTVNGVVQVHGTTSNQSPLTKLILTVSDGDVENSYTLDDGTNEFDADDDLDSILTGSEPSGTESTCYFWYKNIDTSLYGDNRELTISLNVQDQAGNDMTDTLTINLDQSSDIPEFHFDNMSAGTGVVPMDNVFSGSSSIIGRILDDDGVDLASIQVEIDNSGEWQTPEISGSGLSVNYDFPTSSLTQGAHTIRLRAGDIYSDTLSLSTAVPFVYDTGVPEISLTRIGWGENSLTSGFQGAYINSNAQIDGTAADGIAVASVGVNINGQTDGEGNDLYVDIYSDESSQSESVSWSYPLDLDSCDEGSINLKFRAVDYTGKISYSDLVLIKDSMAPEIEFTDIYGSSQRAEGLNGLIQLKGTASDENRVDRVEYALLADSGSVTVGDVAEEAWTLLDAKYSWSVWIDSTDGDNPMADGDYVVYVRALDSSGNVSSDGDIEANRYEFTLDQSTDLPQFTFSNLNAQGVAGDNLIGLDKTTLSGRVSDDDGIGKSSVEINFNNGTTDWTDSVTIDEVSDGLTEYTWSYDLPDNDILPQSADAYTITLAASDVGEIGGDLTKEAVSSNSAGVRAYLDRTAPVLEETSRGSSDLYTTNSVVSFAGTASDGNELAALTLSVNGGEATAIAVNSGDGSWSTTYPAVVDGTTDGNYSLVFTAVDAAGRTTELNRTLLIDGTAPVIPSIDEFTGAYQANELVASGTASDDDRASDVQSGLSLVEYNVDGSWHSVTGTGNWYKTINISELDEGEHTLAVRAADVAGNVSESASASYIIDRSDPGLTETASGISGSDTVYRNEDVTLGGEVSDANGIASLSAVYSKDGGDDVLLDISFDESGVDDNWTAELPVSLGEGGYKITVTAADGVGKTSEIVRNIVIDLTAPVLTITSPDDNENVTDSAYTIRGTATDDEGAGVKTLEYSTSDRNLAHDAKEWIPFDAIKNNWSQSVDFIHDGAGELLVEGARYLTIRASDGLNGYSYGEVDFFSDDTAPAFDSLSIRNSADEEINSLTNEAFTIEGAASDAVELAGVRISASRDGVSQDLSIPAADADYWADDDEDILNRTGNFRLTYTPGVDGDIGDGDWIFTITATDGAGNYVRETYSLEVDSAAPAVPEITSSAADYYQDSLSLQGTAADTGTGIGEIRYFIENGDNDLSGTMNGTESWYAGIDVSALDEGAHSIILTAVDRAGNEGTVLTQPFTVDRSDPDVTVSGSWGSTEYKTSGFAITGTASDNGGAGNGIASVAADGGGAASASIEEGVWTVNVTPSAEGENTVTLSVTDGVGRTTTEEIVYFYDNSVPQITAVNITDGQIFSSSSYTVVGTASDNSGSGIASVEYKLNDADWTAAGITGTETWTLSLSGLSDGTDQTISFRAADKAGNLIAVANAESRTFTVDTELPEVYSITADRTADYDFADGEILTANMTFGGDESRVALKILAMDSNHIGAVSVNIPGIGDVSAYKQDLDNDGIVDTEEGYEVWIVDLSPEAGQEFITDLAAAEPMDVGSLDSGSAGCVFTITDMPGQIATTTRNINIDNTPPTLNLDSHSDYEQVSGAVTLKGTTGGSAREIVYKVTDTSDAPADWTVPLDSYDDPDYTVYGAHEVLNSPSSWRVNFDNDINNSDGYTHDRYLKRYIVELNSDLEIALSGANQGAVVYKNAVGIHSAGDLYTEIVTLYFHFNVTDEYGNSDDSEYYVLRVDPQGDIPVVTLAYPAVSAYGWSDGAASLFTADRDPSAGDDVYASVSSEIGTATVSSYDSSANSIRVDGTDYAFFGGNTVQGGIIRIQGSAEDNEAVSAVYIQIDPTFSAADGFTWTEGSAGDALLPGGSTLGSAYTVESFADGKTGIKVSGTVSWSFTLNASGEFNGAGGSNNLIGLRMYALDNAGNVSSLDPSDDCVITIDSAVPRIGSSEPLYLYQYADNANRSGDVTASMEYSDGMWLKGEWWLEGSVEDENGIAAVTINGSAPDLSAEETWNAGSGNETTGHTFSYLIGSSEEDLFGSLSYTLYVEDGDTPANTTVKEITVNYDNKAPVLAADTDGGFDIDTTVVQSNGFYSLGSVVTENSSSSAVQSGFSRVALYFLRRGALAANQAVYDTYFPKTEGANKLVLGDLTFDSGLYWKTQGVTRSANLAELTLSGGADENIHAGGIVKIGGAVYTITDVSGDAVTIDGFPEDTGSVDALFAMALIVDHNLTESNGSDLGANGYYTDVINDDNDGVVESVTTQGATATWEVNVNSRNIPDGPIEIHYVAFDEAGNYSAGVVESARVANNAPRLAAVLYGTDDDGNNVVDDDEMVSDLFAVNPDGTYSASALSDDYTVNGGEPVMNVKGATKIVPEIVGGNGQLYYSYTVTNGTDTYSKPYQAFSGVEGSDYSGEGDSGEILDSTEINLAMEDFFSADSPYDRVITDGDNQTFEFTIWDSTDESIPGTDSQNAKLTMAVNVALGDSERPTVMMDPFYWESDEDNSLLDNSIENGHIELAGSGSRTLPAVSGHVVMTGTINDNQRIKNIYVTIPGWNGGDKTLVANDDNSDSVFTAPALTGMTFTAVTESIDNAGGQTVGWTMEWDSATLSTIAAESVTVTVEADDFGSPSYNGSEISYANEMASLTTDENAVYEGLTAGAAFDKTQWYYVNEGAGYEAVPVNSGSFDDLLDGGNLYLRSYGNHPVCTMDVVPYIAKVETSLASLKSNNWSVYNRTALGHYPVRQDETITLYGFNLNGSHSAAPYDTTTMSFDDASVSGGISLTVNGVETLNNSNDNGAEYNQQPNEDNNNLLTDDVVLDIWEMDSDAVSPISGMIEQPVMGIDPTDGKLGFAFVNGPLYFSMGDGDYSARYWMGSYDFFTSVGFAYDKLGNTYGVAAGGDINSASADKFKLMSSRWGTSAKAQYGSYGNVNSLRLESIGQKDAEGVRIFNKQRIKSPSLATAVHGDVTNLYLAYYDDINEEIRFKYGNSDVIDYNQEQSSLISEYNITFVDNVKYGHISSNYLSDGDYVYLYDADLNLIEDTSYKVGGVGGGDDNYWFKLINESGDDVSPFPADCAYINKNRYEQTAASFMDYDTRGDAYAYRNGTVSMIAGSGTGNDAGEYVSIAVVSAEGAAVDDVAAAVWYDGVARTLMYSYNTAPTTDRNGVTDGTGWSDPMQIFTGDLANAGEYCQIVADKAGHIHIAAYDPMSLDLVYAYLDSYGDTEPETCVVDGYGVVGSNITLDVALSGGEWVPYIGYYATSCIKPKYAYKVDASANAPAGSEGEAYTGSWEVTVLPTAGTLSMGSLGNNKINIGVWKDESTWALEYPEKNDDNNSLSHSGSSYSATCNDTVYGNGTANPILGYATKSGSSGFIETAQMK